MFKKIFLFGAVGIFVSFAARSETLQDLKEHTIEVFERTIESGFESGAEPLFTLGDAKLLEALFGEDKLSVVVTKEPGQVFAEIRNVRHDSLWGSDPGKESFGKAACVREQTRLDEHELASGIHLGKYFELMDLYVCRGEDFTITIGAVYSKRRSGPPTVETLAARYRTTVEVQYQFRGKRKSAQATLYSEAW